MSDVIFPNGPTDGQIFEAAPGVDYQYSAITNSWFRVIRRTIPLATPLADGLMSADDYRKLTGIPVPPIQTSITAQGCTPVMSGHIVLQGDDVLNITVDDKVNDNTALVKFNLDIDLLIQKLRDLGKLKITAPQGDKGDKGEPGDPGRNALPIGPYGPDGQPGKNAPFAGGLVREDLSIKDDNKAIVNISTQEVGPGENYLVVTRAHIGNPDACPDKIKPKDIQSPWLLGFASRPPQTLRRRTEDGKLVCSWACSSDIYYFNINAIIRSIKARYEEYLAFQKREREDQINQWVARMKEVFEEQKTALACALENSKSKYRNTDARRYIETQKIAAAGLDSNAAGFSINLEKPTEKPDIYEDCKYTVVNLVDPENPIINTDDLE